MQERWSIKTQTCVAYVGRRSNSARAISYQKENNATGQGQWAVTLLDRGLAADLSLHCSVLLGPYAICELLDEGDSILGRGVSLTNSGICSHYIDTRSQAFRGKKGDALKQINALNDRGFPRAGLLTAVCGRLGQ